MDAFTPERMANALRTAFAEYVEDRMVEFMPYGDCKIHRGVEVVTNIAGTSPIGNSAFTAHVGRHEFIVSVVKA